MPIKIGVPKENAEGERRVAMEPSVITRLGKLGAEVLIESGAGTGAYIPDDLFKGATIIDSATDLIKQADMIFRVQAPTLDEVDAMSEGSTLLATIQPHNQLELVKKLQQKKITSYAMELVPRISRAQSMDVLSSQAAIAGYKAAIMGADLSARFFPMLTTAAGTIRPSRVIVIGVGVAGLQAIATAKRLGAIVEAYDVRPETVEQIQSLGAKAIELKISAAGEGGYARELSDDEKKQQQQELASYIAQADVLITTAAVPGRPAPKIIPESTIAGMKSGAVIIDLAAEGGGNCTLTKPNETITTDNGVIIHAPLNVSSQVAAHASEMYAKNLFNFITPMFNKEGEFAPDFEDEVIAGALLTHEGEIKHQPTRELIEPKSSEKGAS
ncbi:MAG: Re/Si-specific NAD(P)(+) transhydrogenase subunit alpha [Cocleimonas sp.]|nr:Re/Si-specific NAD(P)(+) transhydrogenase subunit alpha [Cocleimonas sp.]